MPKHRKPADDSEANPPPIEPQLHIPQSQLDAVLQEASHLRGKPQDAEEVPADALDEIASVTGFSKSMLAEAQVNLQKRQVRGRRLKFMAGVAVVCVLLGGADRAWSTLFPLDPLAAAVKAESLRIEAVTLRFDEDLSRATSRAKEAVRLCPTSQLAQTELGLCYEEGKDPAAAQDAYRKAIALGSDLHDACYAHYNLGAMLVGTPLKQDAEAHFRNAIKCWQDFAPAHQALARLYEIQGRQLEALAAYEATIKADVGYRNQGRSAQTVTARLVRARALLAEAEGLAAQQQLGPALELAHKAVNAYGRNRIAQREMGLDYDGDGQVMRKLADHLFHECQDLHREGHKHHDNHVFSEAIAHCWSAVEVDPDDFQAAYLLAMLYEDLGRHAEAVDGYQLAIEMGGPNVDQAKVFAYLGDTYVKMSLEAEAIAAYQRAIDTRPEDYYAYERLGLVYSKSGRAREARAVYQAGLKVIPLEKHLSGDLSAVTGT